jgi:L,D-transpeptidase YcbB
MVSLHAPWHRVVLGRRKSLASARGDSQGGLSRRSAMALAAACAVAACSDDPDPEADAAPALQTNTELGDLLGGASELSVADQSLNVKMLRRFYARHGFEPVWTNRQTQVDSLVEAVLSAGDQGLNPNLFHADLLRHRAKLQPLDRELVLSDAFLSYADALARGAVPVERRKDDETLTREPIDVTAVLDRALDRRDPAGVIEALAPSTPTYLALLDALQKYRSGAPVSFADGGGPIGRPNGKSNGKAHGKSNGRPSVMSAANRVRAIEVNLERQRWLPRSLPADRVWVNVADERLVYYQDDKPAFTTRVVVGEDVEQNQSPEFRATIDASFYNPPWVIPKDIVAKEILPKLDHDPDYLTKNNMILLANGDAEQLPGPDAGLGLIMFDMPNRFDVYLHDTPDRATIFNLDNRRISHGCIRVQNPREFAALLMQEPIEAINDGIAAGATTRNDLPTPVPVFVVYQTVFLDTDGKLQFRPDFYKRDADIWQQLQKRSDDHDHDHDHDHDPEVQADNRPASSGSVL